MPVIKKPEADLRLRWRKWIELGLVSALLLVIVAFRFFPKDIGRGKKILTVEQEIIKPEEIPQTRQENRPPPPPRPPIPIEAPSDEALSDIDIDISSELDITKEVAPPPPKEELSKKEDEIPFEEQFFMVVEELPEIIGGLESIQRNVVYPEIAVKDFCDFISSFILFALINAISLAEKKADSESNINAKTISTCI